MRLILIAAVLLAGCSGPYRVTATTEQSITVCHDPWLRMEQRAADEATQHCRARGLVAVATTRAQCGLAGVNREVTFECRRP